MNTTTTGPAGESGRTEESSAGALTPFRHRAFLLLWTATVASNVGTWMNEVGAGWLMTTLSPTPTAVSMVQAANTLPVFLFALVAGAVADLVDRRRLLIVVNLLMGACAGLFALAVASGLVTTEILIAVTFLLGSGAAFIAPAWQAIVPGLVSKSELKPAIALNSMGINISRAIGPALAGALIVSFGIAAPFALNALSFVAIILALLIWRPATSELVDTLPKERFGPAIRAGLRYAMHSEPVRATLVRAAAFFLFASAYWSLLPLIARTVLDGGATLYGVLMGAVGLGAVVGALVLPKVRALLGPDRTVAAGTVGTAATLGAFAVIDIPAVAIGASFLAGLSWIAVLTTLNASTQTALPGWVRARGLSIFITLFFGCMGFGSLVWGLIAESTGIPVALGLAAVGALLAIPLSRKHHVGGGDELDLSASMHWPEPQTFDADAFDLGPVMTMVEYQVPPKNRAAFLDAIRPIEHARRRNGAFDWYIMEDPEYPDRVLECFIEASWQDHLRHHHRVTGSDRALQERLAMLLQVGTAPRVTHLVPARTKPAASSSLESGSPDDGITS